MKVWVLENYGADVQVFASRLALEEFFFKHFNQTTREYLDEAARAGIWIDEREWYFSVDGGMTATLTEVLA